MKDRRIAREIAMQVLFQWEAQGQLSRKNEGEASAIKLMDVEYFLGQFLHNFYVKDKTKIDLKFIAQLLFGTLTSINKIDELLDKTSTKWKLSRMDAIDRAILRLSCFELMIQKELSVRIVINEAVEIAKRYSSEQSPAFINGILDAVNESDR
jgi:N utilization substance protein B